MARIKVGRGDSVVIPWITGLVVLGALIWIISSLVDTEDNGVAETEVSQSPDPDAHLMGVGYVSDPGEPPPLAIILPLGPEDENERVEATGEVVGEGTADGYWLLTDRDEVLFVRAARRVEAGERVRVSGTLRPAAEEEVEAWESEAELRVAAGWTVQRRLYLEEDERAGARDPVERETAAR